MDLIYLIAIDDGLEINNIVNLVGENLGYPLPDDANRRRNERPRNQNYFEVTIPRYTDVQFFEHFRMSRGSFEVCIKIYFYYLNRHNLIASCMCIL